jgi:hypothetical protein
MIQLLRVLDKDGRTIHAEAYDYNERAEDHRHPYERCRCIPQPLWKSRMSFLAAIEYKGFKVTATTIYPSRKEA